MAKQILTAEILPTLVGKTISWSAPAAKENHPYGGVSKIIAVDMSQRRPITEEVIEGDELSYAFQDEFNPGYLAYSDSDRFVGFQVIEAN
jgi:hypothetical protein